MIAAFPSGVIADWTDIFGSESRVQRYMFTAQVLSSCPWVKLVVHDDACHMARYCRHPDRWTDYTTEAGWACASTTAMRQRMGDVLWSLDRFHVPDTRTSAAISTSILACFTCRHICKVSTQAFVKVSSLGFATMLGCFAT